MKKYQLNTTHKDDLFRMLFSEKKELLSLYNAVRGTTYTDASLLEVHTLQDATYLSIKNDVSFIIDRQLSIYEHQSTWNGNMPFRNLQYVTDLFAGILAEKNIYGSKTLTLPNPYFVTFYNGMKKIPDRVVQKLSDAYAIDTDEVNLELEVVVLNINHGHNVELMKECRTLWEYSYYIEALREYAKEMSIDEAVEKAIKRCVENDVLAEFLRTHRSEVKHVSIYEYDAEKHIAMEKEESREEGKEIGKEIERIHLIRNNIQKQMSIESLADFMEVDNSYVKKVVDILTNMPEASDEEIAQEIL